MQNLEETMIPQITKQEAEKFSKVWDYNGVQIPLTDPHFKFATDFANVVLKSFVLQCKAQAEAAVKAVQETEKPKIVEA